MQVVITDGGRKASGQFKGEARGDCVTRAIALAMGRPYLDVYRDLLEFCKNARMTSRPASGIDTSNPRFRALMVKWGFEKQNISGVIEDAPKGRVIAKMKRHFCAVINGGIFDNHDPRKNEKVGNQVHYYWVFRGRQVSGISY